MQKKLIFVFALALSIFSLYTAYFGVLTAVLQRTVHLMLASILIALSIPLGKKGLFSKLLIVVTLVACFIVGLYIYFNYEAIVFDRTGNPNQWDLIIGGVLTILVLEMNRRAVGPTLSILGLLSLLYAYFGNYIPGIFGHKGYPLFRIIYQVGFTTEGIFGVPLGVSATLIIMFILFGTFYELSGGGKFFVDFSYGLFGTLRGGPAKMAVIASSFFGMISGSAVANAGSVGPLTIPLMKKVGFKGEVAAGIESVASCGGQIMPPVMGASAFLIAEILGITYLQVCIAAALPALLYYAALFLMVDFEAAKGGIKGLPRSELPSLKKVILWGWLLILPPIVLVYLLAVTQYSPMRAALGAIICIVIVSLYRKETRMGFKKIINALEKGAMGALQVALACACAGIVIGVIVLTGLGLKLSGAMIDLSGGSLPLLLFLTMIASLILGTGLPTVPTYLLLAVLVAPALVKMGIIPISAHLFIFYFGAISDMTPPLAISAYVAAGIAGSDPFRTTLTASRLGLAGYIIPFMFVYIPALVLKGPLVDIIKFGFSALIAVAGMAGALEGYFFGRLSMIERAILTLAAILLIHPAIFTDLIGYTLIAGVGIKQIIKQRRAKVLKKEKYKGGGINALS